MPNPQIPQGGNATVLCPTIGLTDPHQNWIVSNSLSTVIAKDTNTTGSDGSGTWNVNPYSYNRSNSFGKVFVPVGAIVGNNYLLTINTPAAGSFPTFSGFFDVIAAGGGGSVAVIDYFTAVAYSCINKITLTWSVTGITTSIFILGSDGSSYTGLAASGSLDIIPAPNGTTTYVLYAVNTAGTVSSTVIVSIFGVVTPDVTTGLISKFKNGEAFDVGVYKITYQGGAYRPGLGASGFPNNSGVTGNFNPSGYGINAHGQFGDTGSIWGGFKITDTLTSIAAPGDNIAYNTPKEAEVFNSGVKVYWNHTDATKGIGILLATMPFGSHNKFGSDPSFCLEGPVPYVTDFTSNLYRINRGGSVTLTWHSSGGSDVSISGDNGDSFTSLAVNGTQAASPTVTTVYTLTVTDGTNPYTATLIIVVNQPDTPTNVSAAPSCSNTNIISWTAPIYADSVTIYRSTTINGSYTSIGTKAVSAGNSFSDTSATAGSTFYYKITGTLSGGESVKSETVWATAWPTPAQVTGLVAIPGNVQVSFSWNAISFATTYELYLGTTSGGETSYRTGIPGTNVTIYGLANNQLYYFKVRAVNPCQNGALSSEVSATPLATAGWFTF